MIRVCRCGNKEDSVKFPSKGITCQPCVNERQRAYRDRNKNSSTLKYEKTKKGFLVRTYRNMKSRVEGIQEKKAHLYVGKEILDKEDFYIWALSDHTFNVLFSLWEVQGYDRKLTPSIERVDSACGYKLSNMEWLTHSENSRRGVISKNQT